MGSNTDTHTQQFRVKSSFQMRACSAVCQPKKEQKQEGAAVRHMTSSQRKSLLTGWVETEWTHTMSWFNFTPHVPLHPLSAHFINTFLMTTCLDMNITSTLCSEKPPLPSQAYCPTVHPVKVISSLHAAFIEEKVCFSPLSPLLKVF